MTALCRFALILPLLGSAAFAADPLIDLRLLRMDQKTAGLLEKALQDDAASAAGIEDKLDALVKGGTLTELARFRKAFAPHGEILTFEKDREDIKVADGEVLPGGISVETEATAGPSGLRGGQMCEQDNLLEWIHDANGWDTAELGWTLEYSNAIGPDGKLIDLRLKSGWHPPDAKRPPATPDFSYEYASPIPTGTTVVIEPKTRPDIGPVPVIFLTPTLLIMAEGEKPLYTQGLPKEGDLAIITYPVHPSLMRKLAALAAPDPKADPRGLAGPNLRDMLQNMGMEFPAGTNASFNASQGHVVLLHNREGHQRFRAILDQNGLSVKVEDNGAHDQGASGILLPRITGSLVLRSSLLFERAHLRYVINALLTEP